MRNDDEEEAFQTNEQIHAPNKKGPFKGPFQNSISPNYWLKFQFTP